MSALHGAPVLDETAAATDAGSAIDALLHSALAAHRAGDATTAAACHARILALDPGQPDALHFLGVLRHQAGDSEAAIALIAQAMERAPRHADIHNNLGNIHKERGDAEAAEACYRRALAFQPTHFTAIGNLAVALEMQGRLDDAFNAYGLLLNVAPNYGHGYHLLGLFLRDHAHDITHGRQAAACLQRAWELDPDNLRALAALGSVLYLLGEHAAATQVYRDWLQRDPQSPLALHMLAACGGAVAPARAGDAYVRLLFDGFAGSFDEQLLQHLDYRAPQLLGEALDAALDGRRDLDILDAGCGTGLCAALLRPAARCLQGVDLSPGMLERARRRGGYDALVEAELTTHLEAHRGAFDVIASADTLVYFGDLQQVCAAAHGALRADGWFAFTVEALLEPTTDAGTALGPSGRYLHARAHLQSALAAAGFGHVDIQAHDLRTEAGRPVHGWVALAQRGSA